MLGSSVVLAFVSRALALLVKMLLQDRYLYLELVDRSLRKRISLVLASVSLAASVVFDK